MNTQVTTSDVAGTVHGAGYAALLDRVNARFRANCAAGDSVLFTTDAAGLWSLYLDSFADPAERQHHTCHACKQFVERFGALAILDKDNRVVPAVWHEDDATGVYRPAWVALAKAVRRAKLTGVFLSSSAMWGTPQTGCWSHLAVCPPAGIVFKRAVQTADQAMAEKREDYKTVLRALRDYTQAHLMTAVTLLKADALYRSEKVLGHAEWLHALHIARAAARGAGAANVVWRAVATAPAGFCHPRSSMIGTLLDDIAAGKDFDEVSRTFRSKMHPLRYQRPQVAPNAGAIAAAEKLVQQLGAAGALARRFARVDEIQALWRAIPRKPEVPAGGVFGHLKSKSAEASGMCIPAQTMTWEKFRRTVLPTAERIQFLAPACGDYAALVTAVNADAPPILQWDNDGARNPVSWYLWHGGSRAEQFGLLSNQFHEVEAVTLQPSMWSGGYEHQGAGVMFVIAGAHETHPVSAGLFPEILKSEFHGIRAVLEAYSESTLLEGGEDPHAAGVMLQARACPWSVVVRVWSAGQALEYQLDWWD